MESVGICPAGGVSPAGGGLELGRRRRGIQDDRREGVPLGIAGDVPAARTDPLVPNTAPSPADGIERLTDGHRRHPRVKAAIHRAIGR